MLKKILISLISLMLLIVAGAGIFYWTIRPQIAITSNKILSFEVTRLAYTAIIHQNLHPRLKEAVAQFGYNNINGPSLIRVPNWVSNPLGKYYLYFAHHKGNYIRLAYADMLLGLWKIYDGEVMSLMQSGLVTTPGQNSGLETYLLYAGGGEQGIGIAQLDQQQLIK